jgi:hypothetical protein
MSESYLEKVYVFPDGEVYEIPPTWKSDDYEIRYVKYCEKCDSTVVPFHGEPLGACACGIVESPYI